MAEELVLLERDGDVATLVLNDPARLNAMTEAMGEAFAARLDELAADRALRVVILTGAGAAFSAGGDLALIETLAAEAAARPGVARAQIRDRLLAFYGSFLAVSQLPCPSIAAIHGAAIGAGLCVALACDLRLAARDAKLSANFARLGLHPGMGATWTLPRLVGASRAAELLFTARSVSGQEAADLGLVGRAVAPEALLGEARALAAEIAALGPLALRAAKRSLGAGNGVGLMEQLAREAEEQAASFETADVREGIAAARERRAPAFRGR